MHCTQSITENIHWVGCSDRRIALFENMFPLTNGVNYNSYLIVDEKTALLDTVDSSVLRGFHENIKHILNGRELDYLILNHMEPDHCAGISEIILSYPNVKIIGNKKTFQLLSQFYNTIDDVSFIVVNENDEINLGNHTLKFYFSPMVHWPEVMMTYEKTNGILFSADAFGSFGAFTGNLFINQVDFYNTHLDEYRRYYGNIVGKYGPQVQSIIKKISSLDINIICPLHGHVWRSDIPIILEKYNLWSTYTPEESGVVLFYASMYGNTENAVNVLANKLSLKGIKNLKLYDISKTHPSYIISEIFKYSHMVIASPTYNNGLYYAMDSLLHEISALNIQNRTVAIIANGSWAPISHKKIAEHLTNMKSMEIIEPPLVLLSRLKDEQEADIEIIVDKIFNSL